MIIALAQIRSTFDDLGANVEKHVAYAEAAAAEGAALVAFPELSLTGYSTARAEEDALNTGAPALSRVRAAAARTGIAIAAGFPVEEDEGVSIGMMLYPGIFQPRLYRKRILHDDEKAWFLSGTEPALWEVGDERIAPAICYESLQPGHGEAAADSGATLYLASVAKSAAGLKKAIAWYPGLAKKYGMAVALVNGVGPAEDFVSAGGSAVWNRNGKLLATLDAKKEGLLLFDTSSGKAWIHKQQILIDAG